MRLGLIADDLTGAMDTGLQLAKCGLETLVPLSWQRLPDAEVVVVDINSRATLSTEARRRMAAVAPRLRDRLLFKKVDSTMRGNVGYELRAMLDTLHPRCIVVAPAFPRGGRTTYWGHQRVDGHPLELTFFRLDPRWPMTESHLPTLLMQQSGMEVGSVGLGPVEQGVRALRIALQGCSQRIVVVDALTDDHLLTVAQALLDLGEGWLPCGSAGLAGAWAQALGLRERPPVCFPTNTGAPLLLVSGSRNDVALGQLARLSDVVHLSRIDLDPRGIYDLDREVSRLASACRRELDAGRDAILTSSYTSLIVGGGRLVTKALSEAVGRVARSTALGGLFLTGGDIAVAVCQRLGVHSLRIHAEVQAGIPGGQFIGGVADGLWVVTKAGGFGNPDAMLDARAYLRGDALQPSDATM